jgi:REP element-mobilizing transposase RayT
MPPKPRFTLPGLYQHVIQRGNNRESCFRGIWTIQMSIRFAKP